MHWHQPHSQHINGNDNNLPCSVADDMRFGAITTAWLCTQGATSALDPAHTLVQAAMQCKGTIVVHSKRSTSKPAMVLLLLPVGSAVRGVCAGPPSGGLGALGTSAGWVQVR